MSYVERVHEVDGLNRLVAVPMMALNTASVAGFSSQGAPLDLNEVIPEIRVPTMLIWSDAPNDTRGRDSFGLLRGPKEQLHMPEAGLMGGIVARPAEYERRMVGFLGRTIGG